MVQEGLKSTNVIDQPEPRHLGRARTAVITVALLVLLIVVALFLGLRFARTGGSILLGAQHQQLRQLDTGLEPHSSAGGFFRSPVAVFSAL
jgi:hypothetical protein